MSKELEAIEKIRTILGENLGIWVCEEYAILVQSLTPPTADEVCEHLNESFGLKGKNTTLRFIYDKESREFRMVSQNVVYRYISTKRMSDDAIELIDLDIDDIIILGRFYEGEIK